MVQGIRIHLIEGNAKDGLIMGRSRDEDSNSIGRVE